MVEQARGNGYRSRPTRGRPASQPTPEQSRSDRLASQPARQPASQPAYQPTRVQRVGLYIRSIRTIPNRTLVESKPRPVGRTEELPRRVQLGTCRHHQRLAELGRHVGLSTRECAAWLSSSSSYYYSYYSLLDLIAHFIQIFLQPVSYESKRTMQHIWPI